MVSASLRSQPERHYAEHDWHDGPRGGIADVGGAPHYYRAVEDYGDWPTRFFVWAIDAATLADEQELWRTFVEWNDRVQTGEVGPETHPGRRSADSRYVQMESRLEPGRVPPGNARLLEAEFGSCPPGRRRYTVDGVCGGVVWREVHDR